MTWLRGWGDAEGTTIQLPGSTFSGSISPLHTTCNKEDNAVTKILCNKTNFKIKINIILALFRKIQNAKLLYSLVKTLTRILSFTL